jgi:hypothetical protein
MKKLLALFIVLSILVPVVFAQDAGEKGTFTWAGSIRAEYRAADPHSDGATSGMTGDSNAEVSLTYKKSIVELSSALGGSFGGPNLASPYATFGALATNDDFKVNLKLKSAGNFFLDPNFGFGASPIDSLYGWVYLVPGQLRADAVYKGLDEAKWGTPSALDTNFDNLNDNGGIRLVYTPAFLTGLSAGIAVPYRPVAGFDWLGTFFSWGTVIGIKYDAAPLTASVAFKIKESVGSLSNSGSKPRLEGVIGGVKYFVIPETLSVGADTSIHGTGYFTDYLDESYADINVDLGFKVEYTGGAVKAGGISAKLLGLGKKTPDDEPNFGKYYNDLYGGKGYDTQLVLNPYIQYYLTEKVSLLKLSATFTQGLTDYASSTSYPYILDSDISNLLLTLGYFYSLKGDVTDGLGDYSGFMARYNVKFDLSKAKAKPGHDLTVGVRWAF